MPDIDLLLELSHLYGVSINELLEDRDIIKTLAAQNHKVEGVALFDSSAELHDEWAQDMVKEGWIARSWQTAKLPEKRGEQEIGQRIAERGGLVLELGAGPGGGFIPYTLQADPDASIIVSDMSPTVVQEWKKFLDNELDSPNLSYAAFDYCQIPFRDSCIDVVSDRGGIANAITAKYEPGDKGAALKETYRVLKPGGLFVTASGFVTKETLAKGVHAVVLGQFGIGLLELADLLGIEHMDLALEPAQGAILTESIDKIIPVDAGGLHADHDLFQAHCGECRHNFIYEYFSTALSVLYSEITVLFPIGPHEVCCVSTASHINANE